MSRLRVLLVPDWLNWVTGTIARDIARHDDRILATILSGRVLVRMVARDPAFFERFQLVHFLCPYASRQWLATLRAELPVVTSHYHVTDFDELAHNLAGDAIVAISSEWEGDLQARGADMRRVIKIPPGVDTEMFRPSPERVRSARKAKLGFAAEQPVIGFFAKAGSNDDDRKGTDVLLSAASRLNGIGVAPGFLVVGPGWASLVQRIRKTGASCRWLPFVEKRHDVARLYDALDFYWVTSRVEGGPLPLLEAMSSGIPCLSTPVGFAADLGEDARNMMLMPFNEGPAFADATASLWKNRGRMTSLSLQGRRTVLEKADARVVSREFMRAYERATENFRLRNPGTQVSHGPAIPGSDTAREIALGVDEVPRHQLTGSEARYAAMLEKLLWGEHLAHHKAQRWQAIRAIVGAWWINPFCTAPSSSLLRHFLPAALVRGIVKAKRQARRLRAQAEATSV